MDSRTELQARKSALRAQALRSRRELPDKDELSRRLWQKLFSLPEYRSAQTVMVYLDLPDEVRTQPYLSALQQQGKRAVVPYCEGNELGLFRFHSFAELEAGAMGILEPRSELRALPASRADVAELDFLIVPGVAFDRQGYYDRLLGRVRADALLVGVAFECQLYADVPMLPYDVYMDKVVTETAVYGPFQRIGIPQRHRS